MNRPLLIVLLLMMLSPSLHAQLTGAAGASASDSTRKFKFMPIPYINYNRSLDFAYGIIPMAMFPLSKKDTISPSSLAGAMYIRTTNDTDFYGGFTQLFLNEDRYRLVVAGGGGNINFQFFPDIPGLPEIIDYRTSLDFFIARLQRRVFKSTYAGLGYVYQHFTTSLDNPLLEDSTTTLNGLNIIITRDTRDDVYYPLKGYQSELNMNTFPEGFGNEGSSNKYELTHNHFWQMPNERDIIAFRGMIGFSFGELDFNQQFVVGGTDLRGYSQGEFRGEQIYSIQGEYRWNPFKTIGFVGFGGFATVVNEANKSNNGKILPGIGAGFRWTAFKENHFNVGLDIAGGTNDWSLQFRIGEAF